MCNYNIDALCQSKVIDIKYVGTSTTFIARALIVQLAHAHACLIFDYYLLIRTSVACAVAPGGGEAP